MAKFIDEAIISVRSGKGGPGCVAFRREKFIPFGGPNGGDGGKGGDIIFRSTHNLGTLQDFRYMRSYEAKNGSPGSGGNKTGPDAEDIVILVPNGTVLRDTETQEILADLANDDDEYLACKGGRGGKGNAHFATSTNQAPKFAQPGEEGESKSIKLELKLLADVGLVGYPNAGKSTLISKISAARPKVADYPFTTLVPNLGVVRLSQEPHSPTFVVADVPGLIEGASLGRGLGIKFLKHLERTKLLVHMIDGAKLLKEVGAEDPALTVKAAIDDKEIIDAELYTFSPELAVKPQILVFNKCDLYEDEYLEKVRDLFLESKYPTWVFISGAAHQGLKDLVQTIYDKLNEAPAENHEPTEIVFQG